MSVEQTRYLIEQCINPRHVGSLYGVIHGALQKLLGPGRQPREQQIRAVRRLVYRWGDTFLIAKTSFEHGRPTLEIWNTHFLMDTVSLKGWFTNDLVKLFQYTVNDSINR